MYGLMNRRVRLVLIFLIVVFLAFAPFSASAGGILDGALVPQCFSAGQSGIGFVGACQLCDLVKLANNLIRFAVAFSVIVATLMFTYAGVLYFTAAANPDNIKKAHGIFMKVFAGLIIVLIAWLVIDLLMKVLTGGDFGVWNDVPCAPYQEGPALGQYNPPPVGGSAGGPGPGWTSTPPQTPIQWTAEREAAVRAQFQAAGIPINKAACPDGSANCPGGGTSVGNLQSSTLNYALALRQACSNCEVVVTGGTEWGGADPHAHGPLSHISGHKIDFRTTQGLNEYVQRRVADGRFVQQPQRLGTYIDVSTTGSGTVWRNEGDHWDVCVRCVTRANP